MNAPIGRHRRESVYTLARIGWWLALVAIIASFALCVLAVL